MVLEPVFGKKILKKIFFKKKIFKNFLFKKFFILLKCLKHHNCGPDGSRTGFWKKNFQKNFSKKIFIEKTFSKIFFQNFLFV